MSKKIIVAEISVTDAGNLIDASTMLDQVQIQGMNVLSLTNSEGSFVLIQAVDGFIKVT